MTMFMPAFYPLAQAAPSVYEVPSTSDVMLVPVIQTMQVVFCSPISYSCGTPTPSYAESWPVNRLYQTPCADTIYGTTPPYSGDVWPGTMQIVSPDIPVAYQLEKLPHRRTRYVALDCEMVGIGPIGKGNALARVSICDVDGLPLLDCLVKPEQEVVDYRTHVTGIREGDLDKAASFEEVRIKVINIIRKKILIGHALENDLKVLELAHPAEKTRDTAHAKFLRDKTECPWNMPGLKKLVDLCLPADFPFRKGSGHDSLEDARAPMEIYKRHWKEFESEAVTRQAMGSPTPSN